MIVLWFLAGWFTWTFGEYVMHRFTMHAPRGRGLASRAHLLHHSDRDSILEYWGAAWSGIIGLGVAFVLRFGLPVAFAVGWVAGYGFYDLHHWRAHRRPVPSGWWGRYERRLRRHHFHHHFRRPSVNHGVTWPLWDKVFGTYEDPGVVRVPRRLALPWLLDDEGYVRPEYAADYAVVGARPRTREQLDEDRHRAYANLAPQE